MITVRPTQPQDIPALAREMRQEDIDEVWASSRSSPEAALKRAVEHSKAWTAEVSGRVVAIMGVGPGACGVGVPWMLRVERLGTSSRSVQVVARCVLEWFLAEFPVLENATNNPSSEAWLQSLGFSLGEHFEVDHQDGEKPEVFRHFYIRKESQCVTSSTSPSTPPPG